MFKVKTTRGKARRAELTTNSGTIQTPFFMPIATQGAIKSLSTADMEDLQAQILLSNTYHLMLRPGFDGMKQLGGLHSFMSWEKPLLTDSGGYQVFSLAKINETHEDGVSFQSHIDGSKIKLTPEGSMAMQSMIGADIIMQFDDVAAGNSTRDRYEDAMKRSLRWAEVCKDTHDARQQLFGIVQGGVYSDLREESARGLMDIGFDGYAIGGLSVGEERQATYEMAAFTAGMLPEDKPRYFMGGGMPEEIVYYVSVGIDMFDCVLPTRNARHGTLFLWKQEPKEAVKRAFELAEGGATPERIAMELYDKVQITRSSFEFDQAPIDVYNEHPETRRYSRAYLRHLLKTNELLGYRLATLQNIQFYLRLMRELRAII